MRLVGWVGCLVLALGGCGDDDGGSGGNQQFACDIGASSSTHLCYEWNWNGPENAADAYTGVCESGGATTVSACPSAGKVGGCRYVATSGTTTVTWTNWFYFGTAQDHMPSCMSGGGITATWVNP
jgi:hypothetical protein